MFKIGLCFHHQSLNQSCHIIHVFEYAHHVFRNAGHVPENTRRAVEELVPGAWGSEWDGARANNPGMVSPLRGGGGLWWSALGVVGKYFFFFVFLSRCFCNEHRDIDIIYVCVFMFKYNNLYMYISLCMYACLSWSENLLFTSIWYRSQSNECGINIQTISTRKSARVTFF